MPTMAMEPRGSQYNSSLGSSYSFSTRAPVESKAARERRRQQQAQQDADELQRSLVARSRAMAAIAEKMHEQNQKMLEGLSSLSVQTGRRPKEKIDFVERNIADVGPSRSALSRKEQSKIAMAQTMAAATSHLGGVPDRSRPPPRQPMRRCEPTDTTDDDLVAAVRAELERSGQISDIERQGRRAPQRDRRIAADSGRWK